MPVEYFPPAINTARYFAEKARWEVAVCTNRNHLGRQDFSHPSVNLVRGSFPTGKRGLLRITSYLSFHFKSLIHLLKFKPEVILYIEPHSALPVFLSRFFWRKSLLFIHYHEYHRPGDFKHPGMRVARLCNFLERRWLYPAASWISQTNQDRLQLFLDDNPDVGASKARLLPNYPPSSWWTGCNRAWSQPGEPVRMVYVGALSRADTFIEDVVTWVMRSSTPATLDIFSYNMHSEARSYLQSVACGKIRFHEEGVNYDDLSGLLRGFHVGLILYKGNTPNYIFNASNKLFEYLACGLDVIYPKQMKGVKPYATMTQQPRVIECDFENMDEFAFRLEGRMILPKGQCPVTCELALASLERAMRPDAEIQVA